MFDEIRFLTAEELKRIKNHDWRDWITIGSGWKEGSAYVFLSARDAERQMHRLLYVETRNVKENSQSEWYPDRIFADDFGKNRPAPIVTADYPVLIRRIFEWNMKV